MLELLAQAETPWFATPGGSQNSIIYAVGAMLLGFAIMAGLMAAPPKLRRPIVVSVTFLAGFYYVLFWLWPRPVELSPEEVPNNTVESIGRWLADGVPGVSTISQTLAALLLGLGVYSVLRLHLNRLLKKQKDWIFSLVLLLSMVTMIAVGYRDYWETTMNPNLANRTSWEGTQYFKDFLFDGMLQAMDAAMFSIIAFFILFAAYRAFRIRSVESTVLLATALIVMLALMGGVEYWVSETVIRGITGGDSGHFMANFALAEVRAWIAGNVQGPAIQALAWGIGIGALSMGLRLWLSLEKTGGN